MSMSDSSPQPPAAGSPQPDSSETTSSFFSFLGQRLNVSQLQSTIEAGANELVEFGRRSGFADRASVIVEAAKENALELAKQAQELRESYERLHTEPLHGSQSRASVTINVDLDLTYITENIIAMAFPYDRSKAKQKVIDVAGNDIRQVAAFLENHHAGHYMIWNISEEAYDYSFFNDQVLDYKFPGHPAPPLGLMFKICTTIESWLDADAKNVAVVHCYTGKGRTATLLACALCWIGEFSSPTEALQYVAERRGITPEKLTIASQRRYVQYFSNMVDGVKPRSEPLLLRRVIMNTIPIFAESEERPGSLGCMPYIQLFKNGKLIASVAPNSSDAENRPRWVDQDEGSLAFNVDCPVQGDILIRCRHCDRDRRVSMFRAGFHTGYVPVGVLRLTRAQLDGPATDSRFGDDFFVDLIFAPVVDDPDHAASKPSDMGLSLDKDTAEACELFMHRDARFWEAIHTRKTRSRRRASRKYMSSSKERFSIADDILIPDTAPSMDDGIAKKEEAGISYEDLIAELSRAEAETDVTTPAIKAEKAHDSTFASDLAFLEDEFSTPATGPVDRIGTSNAEKALEDLEKELGLEEFILPKPDDSSHKKIAQLQSAVDDDIDELERYLNSLNSGSTPNK